jgi:hypothetical protein
MFGIVVPPYWWLATWAMIWAVTAQATPTDLGLSMPALPRWKPFASMPCRSTRQQLVKGRKGE